MESGGAVVRGGAGGGCAAVGATVGAAEAELLFCRAPGSIRRFAYEPIRGRYGPLFQSEGQGDTAVDLQGRTFDEVFPEPEGMDEHRAMIERKLRDRTARERQGVRQK